VNEAKITKFKSDLNEDIKEIIVSYKY